jgi:hypothetical protein
MVMEDSQKEIFSQVQGNLKEILQELYAEQKSRLGDLTQWSEKQLIITGQSFEFWCVDALVRLIRLPDDKNLDVWKLYDQIEEIAARLTLNELTECYFQTRDAKSVIALAVLRIDVEAIQKEIQGRLKPLEMGTVFSSFIDHESEDSLVSMLNVTGRKGLLRKRRWVSSPGTKDLSTALQQVEVYTIRSDREYGVKEQIYRDKRNDALSTMLDFYSQLQKAIELGDLDAIPFSMVGEFRPVNNPAWEEKVPLMMKEIIEEVTRRRLPILDGSMEKAPDKVYDSHRTEDRRGFITYKRQKVCKKCGGPQLDDSPSCPDCGGDWEIIKMRPRFKGLSDKNEDSEGLTSDRITFEYNKIEGYDEYTKEAEMIGTVFQKEFKKRYGINQQSEAKEVFERIKASFVKKTKTNKKVVKALELILLEGKNEQEALKETKLSDRTWRDYKKNMSLNLKP